MLEITYIGRAATIPGWPETDTVDGLIDAIGRWELDRRMDFSTDPRFQSDPLRAPFRGPARRYNGAKFNAELGHAVYENDGDNIYPDAPNAVIYCGNFIGYSFGFSLATDDADIIARIDAAISKNLCNP